MFRVTCFCEDNRLGVIKRALAEVGAKDVRDLPVVNAIVGGNGKMKAEVNGGLTERVWAQLIKAKIKAVDTAGLRATAAKQGGSAKNVYNLTAALIKQGRLKRAGRGKFIVNRRAT